MCGISGYFQNNISQIQVDKINRVKQTLNHRGPDNFSYYKHKKIIFFITDFLLLILIRDQINQWYQIVGILF